MSGNKQGGAKLRQTIIDKHGPDYWSKMGRKGGRNGTGHVFGHGKVDPGVIGKIGGLKSRRRPRKAK